VWSSYPRQDDGIDDSLPRHLRWHAVARELLGLPPPPAPPLPDYVSSLNIWDREVVRGTLRRTEDVTGRRWLDAIGKELRLSEWTVDGILADELEQAKDVAITSDSLCHSYWDTVPSPPKVQQRCSPQSVPKMSHT
jgi:hypothetical protein